MAVADAPRSPPIPLRGSRVPGLGEQSAARGDGVKGAAPRDGARSAARRGGAGAERLRRTFIECDLDGDGYLSREDFKVAVLSLCGYKPSKTETDHLMASVKEKNLPGMPFDEFRRAVSTRLASVDFDDETRRIFTAFDTCCRGFLTVEDFRKAFSLVAPHLSGQTILETFRETDRDLDGRVSYRDFETAMAARRGCR
ncbi:EF-hand calcium-binding domain-containing protein 11 [Petromyzon marinus]|uniref:EF-hand calcium-binding domain-containing protein 11 n=1 Tax=Petromyzon marinus TaxID=7757 RepID=A0AAJ7XD75_PETMA|nr:EF-hand calcium-binding domain-containing protein 11 [Petromyzon marinus]